MTAVLGAQAGRPRPFVKCVAISGAPTYSTKGAHTVTLPLRAEHDDCREKLRVASAVEENKQTKKKGHQHRVRVCAR